MILLLPLYDETQARQPARPDEFVTRRMVSRIERLLDQGVHVTYWHTAKGRVATDASYENRAMIQ
jgi:hypothetical protein